MTITIFTLPNCVQCDSTKRYFDRANVDYEVVDLSINLDEAERLKQQGFLAAPIVETNLGTWSGFRLDKIKTIIAELDAKRGKQ